MLDALTLNKRGAWCFATNASGAPTTADTINQDQVNDGNYTLVLAATQQNSDWTFKSPAYTAADFESGDVLYIHPYDPYDADNYYKVTLTSNATLVGTGNAAYLWMSVTVDEVGSVTSASDGWRITETPPTSVLAGLRGRLPISEGLPVLSQTTKLLLSTFEEATLARLGKHIRPDTTEPTEIPATFETTNVNIKNGNNLIGILNPVVSGAAQIKWGLGATVNDADGNSIAESEIQDRLNIHHDISVSEDDVILKGTIASFTKVTIVGEYFYQITLQDATQVGTFTDGASVDINISSNLIARDEISQNAFVATEPVFTDWTPTLENTQGADTFTQNWVEYKIESYASEKRVTVRLDITASHSSNSNFSALRLDLPMVPGTGAVPSRVTCFGNPIDSHFKRMQCGINSNKIRVVVEKQANDGNAVNFNAEIHYKTAA